MRRFKEYRETSDNRTWKVLNRDDFNPYDFDYYYWREPRITSWKRYRKTQYRTK